MEPIGSEKKAEQTKANIVEIAQTIQSGGVPSNEQLTSTIDSTIETINQRTREVTLDAKGRDLAYDTRNVLESAKTLLEEKNPDEKLQRVVLESKEVQKDLQGTTERVKRELEDPNMQYSAEHLYDITRRLVYQMAYSREMRETLIELIDILDSVFWRNVRLTESNIQEAKAKPVEIEETKGGLLGAEKPIGVAPVSVVESPKKPSLSESLKAEKGFGQPTTTVETKGTFVKESLKEDVRKGEPSLPTTTGVVKQTFENVKEVAQTRPLLVPMSESEKQEMRFRIRRVLRKLAKNEDYQRAVQIIFRLFESLRLKVENIQQQTDFDQFSGKHKRDLTNLWEDLRDLVERWSGRGSVQIFIDNCREFLNLIDSDTEAHLLYEETKTMTCNALKNPQLLDSEAEQRRWDSLIERSQAKFYDIKYRSYADTIATDARRIINNITSDPTTRHFTDSIAKFSQDFIRDRYGRPSLGAFSDSLNQLRVLLLPVMIKQLESVPVARVEGTSPTYDFVLDNIKFSGYDILPEHVRLFLDTKMDINLKEGPKNDITKAILTFEITNIQTHLRNIYFAYRRKSFPKIEDEGLADVDVKGGTSIRLQWIVKSKGDQPLVLRVNNAKCDISGLKIYIKEAKHSFLDKMFSGILAGYAGRKIEEEVENQLRNFGWTFADSLNSSLRNISFSLPSSV